MLMRNLRPRELEGLLRVLWWQSRALMRPSWCSARFFQEPRVGGPRRICLRSSATDSLYLGGSRLFLAPHILLFGKIIVSCQLGTVYLSGARPSERPEIQGKPSKSRVKATASCPLSVRSQPSSVPPGKRLRHKSEPVKITSLGAGRNAGSSDSVSLLTWTGALIILMRRNWNLGKGCPGKPDSSHSL